MGLDVSVYKPVPLGDRKPQDVEDVFTLTPESSLMVFKDFAFERVKNSYYDLEKAFKDRGLDPEKYHHVMTAYGETTTFKFRKIDSTGQEGDEVDFDDEVVEFVDPPTYEKTELVLDCEEVGYQRKGANSQFYADDMWGGSDVVLDLKTLEEHWLKYFSDPVDSPHYEGDTEYMKRHFKENIIDNFLEGSNVCYLPLIRLTR